MEKVIKFSWNASSCNPFSGRSKFEIDATVWDEMSDDERDEYVWEYVLMESGFEWGWSEESEGEGLMRKLDANLGKQVSILSRCKVQHRGR